MVCTCRSPATQNPVGGRGPRWAESARTGPAAAKVRQAARAARRRTGRTSVRACRTPVVMSWVARRRRAVALTAALALCVPVASAARADGHHAGDAMVARADAATAVLGNGKVARTWSLAGGAVRTIGLTGAGRQWVTAAGDDFALNLDGVPTTSTTGWTLASVTPATDSLLFRYALVSTATAPVGIELDRRVVLRPGSKVFETTSTLIDNGPAPARVSSYTLDQITTAATLPAEVQAYNGGSDWRDDYRHVSNEAASFDDEVEVWRAGGETGLFLVSQRRGGAMSRVGRDATGRTYVGVDWARDLFDYGPLQTDPPSYNRLENPAYPVPVRARVLRPLSSLDLGTAFLGVYSGGVAEAAAAFTSDFAGAVEPAYAHSVDLNTFHPWGHGDGLSDANLRPQVDVAKSLGVETFMLDDQWQGGAGGESGDWQWDPARFPDSNGDGRPDFVDYLHQQGVGLGLWMSPLEFNMASQTYAAHPDWACAPVGHLTAQVPDDAGLGVWDATSPAFQDYLLGVVDRLVATNGVREFKFDFMAWVDCADHDYTDYEDAFVSMVRTMEQRHPNVTFELDETNDQRAWPFESAALGPSWFDNGHLHGSTAVAKLLHDVWSAAPWVPPATLGLGVYDGTLTGPYSGVAGVDALWPLAMLTHATFWTDLTKLSDDQRAETARWTSWYAAHRAELGPAVYELTGADPIDGQSWAAWQPWNGNAGYVFAFRQAGGPDTMSLALHGVDPHRSYAVADVRTGERLGVYRGALLSAGLPVSVAEYGARVLSVQPWAAR